MYPNENQNSNKRYDLPYRSSFNGYSYNDSYISDSKPNETPYPYKTPEYLRNSTSDQKKVSGQIKDNLGNIVSNAHVKLLKPSSKGYEIVAETITNNLGLYEFNILPYKDGYNFTIIVNTSLKVSNTSECKIMDNEIYDENIVSLSESPIK